MLSQAIRLMCVLLTLTLFVACRWEKTYTSNSIERTSKFFKDGKHELVYNIINEHLKKPEITYERVKYQGNSFGHLFTIKTPESTEKRMKILFKVVDNTQSEFSIYKDFELTAFRDEKKYTVNGILFESTDLGVKIYNEDFTISLAQ